MARGANNLRFPSLLFVRFESRLDLPPPTSSGYETFQGLPGGIVAIVFRGAKVKASDAKIADDVAKSASGAPTPPACR
jgi:hypothetical protein